MKKSETSKSGSGKGTLVVRLVVFGVLGVLLVLGFLDFQQRKFADQTVQKFDDFFKDNEYSDLRRSGADELIVGAPVSTVVESAGENGSILIETLTWTGTFQESKVIMYLGLPKHDPSVLVVEKASGDASE